MLQNVLALTMMVMTLGGLLVGLFYFFKLGAQARADGFGTPLGRLAGFDVYRYAFTVRKDAPETRRMLLGFGIALLPSTLLWVVKAIQ